MYFREVVILQNQVGEVQNEKQVDFRWVRGRNSDMKGQDKGWVEDKISTILSSQ